MPSGDWYCQFDGKTDGPYSFDELVYLVRRNRLALKSQVRRGEEGNWITADCVSNLFPRKPSSSTSPEETPKDDAPEQIEPELVESDEDELDIPNISDPSPPPLPTDSPPIGKSIAAGAIALLLLLLVLLALLFWHGDGGEGTAKGTGGNAAGSGSSSGTSGDNGDGGGTATANSNGGTDSQHSEVANAGDNSEGGDESAESSGAKEKQENGPPKKAQANQNSSPAEKEENATTEKKKPIPAAMNAIAYDVKKQNATPQASVKQNAGKKGGAEGGPGQEGTFFGVKAKGRHFVYIVDCSSSMAGGRFARVCEELIRSVKYLTKKQSFYVFFFNTAPVPMFGQANKEKLLAKPKNIRRLEEWVSQMRASGGTDPSLAFSEGVAMEPDAIFFLTDGEIPGHIPDTLRNLNIRQPYPLSKSKKKRAVRKVTVPINTIGLGSPSGEPILKQIAAENDGEYRFIPDPVSQSPGFPGVPAPAVSSSRYGTPKPIGLPSHRMPRSSRVPRSSKKRP